VELGDKDGLQMYYDDQAVSLRRWGQLDEAMALHKKAEALCVELDSKLGLGHCYWNWGLLTREMNDPKTAREKLKAALEIFTELNMPRERDAVKEELEKT